MAQAGRRSGERRGRELAAAVACALALAPAAALPGIVACARETTPGVRGVRIVLVTLDTLRYDGFAGAAAGAAAMPQLRRFAAAGQTFTRAFAATPATQPTHASLFTGLHPWEHGLTRNGQVLAERHETLAERLAAAGFHTGAVVASFPLDPRFGFAQGFERYVADYDRGVGFDRWEQHDVGERFYSQARAVSERALALLNELPGPRQFVWLHYFDPHDPYGDSTRRPLLGRDLRQAASARDGSIERALRLARRKYARDVAWLDAELGRVLERLREDADRLETHVLVTADHGESFGEHGALQHGTRVTPEQVHVPLVLVSPRAAPGVRSDPAGSVDVAATILALAGLDPGAARGRDLLAGAEATAEGVAPRAVGMSRSYAAPFPDLRASGEEVPLRAPRFFLATASGLYTGRADAVTLGDAEDRPAPEPDPDAARARELFARFEAALAGARADELVDEETRQGLRALGYSD